MQFILYSLNVTIDTMHAIIDSQGQNFSITLLGFYWKGDQDSVQQAKGDIQGTGASLSSSLHLSLLLSILLKKGWCRQGKEQMTIKKLNGGRKKKPWRRREREELARKKDLCLWGTLGDLRETQPAGLFNMFDRQRSHGEPSVIHLAFTPLVPAARWRCSLSDIFSPLLPLAALSLSSSPPLPLLVWPSLAGHGVAAEWVPLHVTDAPHRLELRAASAVLVKVSVFALFQQELAATVSGELIAHPTAQTSM